MQLLQLNVTNAITVRCYSVPVRVFLHKARKEI